MESSELVLYFDGRCPLCVAQIRRLGARDAQQRLAFVDIADPEAYANPDAFDARRTMYQTFTLGYGHHECLGRAIATVMLPEIVRQVLLLPNLQAAGPVEWKNGVPEHYPLRWDA